MVSNEFNKDYLSFVIDDKTYAVPILALMGIVGNPNIRPIFESVESVVGIFNMNNVNIPVFDLRLILNKPDTFYSTRTCVLIIRVVFKGQEKLVGFIVDSLYSIYPIQVTDTEKLSSYCENEYIKAVAKKDEKLIMILSLEKIINNVEIIYFLNQFWNLEDSKSQKNKNGV